MRLGSDCNILSNQLLSPDNKCTARHFPWKGWIWHPACCSHRDNRYQLKLLSPLPQKIEIKLISVFGEVIVIWVDICYPCGKTSVRKHVHTMLKDDKGNFYYVQAIQSSAEGRLTLAQIYDWMIASVPYFGQRADSASSAGWKVRYSQY